MDTTKIDEATSYQAMQQAMRHLINVCLGAAGLAESDTSGAKIKTTNNVDYVIDGKVYTKTATAAIDITDTGTTQSASTYCKYLVSINAAGTVTVTAGEEADTAAEALLPDLPANSAPLGYFQIATAASYTYDCGTTDNGATGITDTYVDMYSMLTAS